MRIETLERAEQQQAIGGSAEWDNYDMVFFRPDPRGATSKNGALKNGQWGFVNRSPLGADGTWEVDNRNVKRTGRYRRN